MQTFLLGTFEETARLLDRQRLGSQRREAKGVLRMLNMSTMSNQPIVKMWAGYELALCLYLNTILDEWERRGYKNNMLRVEFGDIDTQSIPMPPWMGEEVYGHYRARLLDKAPDFYGQYGWTETPETQSWFPVEWSGNRHDYI